MQVSRVGKLSLSLSALCISAVFIVLIVGLLGPSCNMQYYDFFTDGGELRHEWSERFEWPSVSPFLGDREAKYLLTVNAAREGQGIARSSFVLQVMPSQMENTVLTVLDTHDHHQYDLPYRVVSSWKPVGDQIQLNFGLTCADADVVHFAILPAVDPRVGWVSSFGLVHKPQRRTPIARTNIVSAWVHDSAAETLRRRLLELIDDVRIEESDIQTLQQVQWDFDLREVSAIR